jgi:hypothetical protein
MHAAAVPLRTATRASAARREHWSTPLQFAIRRFGAAVVAVIPLRQGRAVL